MTSQESPPLDLVILVPGKDESEAMEGLLCTRRKSLGIRSVRYEILVHPGHDAGCFTGAPQFLRMYQGRADHALVLFDHEGSGQEGRSCPEVEDHVRQRLASSGWGGNADVVVVRPELEAWVWSDSPKVDEALGWRGHQPSLRVWLREAGYLTEGQTKPSRPKESLEAALREVRMPQSSALFRRLAEEVGLERCSDTSFLRLKEILRRWFS